MNSRTYFLSAVIGLFLMTSFSSGQMLPEKSVIYNFTISMPDPSNHLIHVELSLIGAINDTLNLRMPVWMPGYYQIMDYPDQVFGFRAKDSRGKDLFSIRQGINTWKVASGRGKAIDIEYDVKADKRFVANSWLDTTHCYLIPAATFMYCDGYLKSPVTVKLIPDKRWPVVVTGLEREGGENIYTAPDFDILYDSPFLAGKLEELPEFKIKGITHRFIAYKPGTFDKKIFIESLKIVITAGTEIIGDIPYSEYTFIGIGQGYGGIEHLNNTTVSFNGSNIDNDPAALQRTLLFLAHEYFHNYNVKRIRPFELGPFDYNKENRTNLLWVSEGLSVYYEYLMVRRSGMMNDKELLRNISGNITEYENDPGKEYQSLIQASYNTWSDGPFGNRPGEDDRAISYYEKGPLAGLIIDFTIRKATGNSKSLDDVMRQLYHKYYIEKGRGFTDAEFQEVCEEVATVSLSREFEYVSTTKEIDYSHYLSFAGLTISSSVEPTGKKRFTISENREKNSDQQKFFNAWVTGK